MIQKYEFYGEIKNFCNGLLDAPLPPAPVDPCYMVCIWAERHINVTLGWGIPWQEIHKAVRAWWDVNGHHFE